MIARVAPGAAGRTHPSGDARVPGLADRGQRRARRIACAAWSRPSGFSRRAAGLRSLRSTRSRIASSSSSSPAARGAAAPPRACCRASRPWPQPTFEVPRGQPVEPGEARGLDQSAVALGQASLRGAARCAGAGGGRGDRGADAVAGAAREAWLMWRLMHAAAIAALIGSAAYVYGVKYRTIYASEQLVKTRHLIAKEKDAINLLRAEYAHLARPDRLQALADSKLGMQRARAQPDRDCRRIARGPAQGRIRSAARSNRSAS